MTDKNAGPLRSWPLARVVPCVRVCMCVCRVLPRGRACLSTSVCDVAGPYLTPIRPCRRPSSIRCRPPSRRRDPDVPRFPRFAPTRRFPRGGPRRTARRRGNGTSGQVTNDGRWLSRPLWPLPRFRSNFFFLPFRTTERRERSVDRFPRLSLAKRAGAIDRPSATARRYLARPPRTRSLIADTRKNPFIEFIPLLHLAATLYARQRSIRASFIYASRQAAGGRSRIASNGARIFHDSLVPLSLYRNRTFARISFVKLGGNIELWSPRPSTRARDSCRFFFFFQNFTQQIDLQIYQ